MPRPTRSDLIRGGTEGVDHSGDSEPFGRALRGEGADADEREDPHALASLYGGDQPLQQAQGRSAELPAAAHDDSPDGQRDHQRPPEEGDQKGLRDHTGHGRGPSRVRGAQQLAVLRAPGDPAEVCGLGDAHSPRGSVRLPPSSSGGMASREQGQASGHAQRHQGDQEEVGQPQGWGGERSFLRIQEHVRSRGDAVSDHAADGQHAPAPEGGSGDHQGRASSQEDSRDACVRGRLLHGLLQRGEHGLGLGDAGSSAACVDVDDSCVAYEGNGSSHLDVKDNWESLPEAKARHLTQCSDRLLPEAFEALVGHQRVELLEVACSPDSILTSTMQKVTKQESAARRCSLFNTFDLSTNRGIHGVINEINTLQPKHVWLSPICGPYSVMQNINQRSPSQCEDLARKRREALKQYVGCALIYRFCIQQGIHCTWEWSQSCQAWRLPLIQELVRKFQPFFAIVRGCRVGLCDKHGSLVSKGWKLMTTHKLLAERMTLPCQCGPKTVHVKCEGSVTSTTAYYTPDFGRRVCQALLQGSDRETVSKELNGAQVLHAQFGVGLLCQCQHGKEHDANLQCGMCALNQQKSISGDQHDHNMCQEHEGSHEGSHEVCQDLKPQKSISGLQHDTPVSHVHGRSHEGFPRTQVQHAMVGQPSGDGPQPMEGILSREEIRRRLYLLHSATGHGPISHLIQALRRRGVSSEVMEEAQKFSCSVCQERRRPKPRPMSTLEPHPPKWTTVATDVGHWIHPKTREHVQFVLTIDEGSRFRVGRIVLSGKKTHISAAQFLETFQESWTQYFGLPHTLRVDPDGTFRSATIQDFCDRHHIHYDIIPGEAHWKLGICEQAIQGAKYVMSKLAEENPETTPQEALAEATRIFNGRDLLRGYSPQQHALGRAPDHAGKFFPQSLDSPDLLVENATGEMSRTLERMKVAETSFLEWTNQQRLSKATHSKARRLDQYSPGDLVFIWRKQVSGQAAVKGGSFIGPARILAVEVKQSTDGSPKESSSIWCVRGRRLLKCSPEQLRMASERETILAELDAGQYEDWDFHRVAQQLGGNEFLDVSHELPGEEEWRRAQDPEHEWQPMTRCRGKRGVRAGAVPPPPPLGQSTASSSRQRSRSRVPPQRGPADGHLASPPWWQQQSVQESVMMAENSFWCDTSAAVSVEVEMPHTRSSSERALEDLPTYLAYNLKRRTAVEVSEKRLTPEERAQFQSAKAVEVNNFIAARAFEAVPERLRPSRDQAIRMRWILTWKTKDDGTRRPKARAVLLGYQDPSYERRATHSPTTTRQTRQLQLQVAASKGFTMRKGDVTGAFLQSRPYPDDLYCIPCPEICEAMGLAPETITRVKKACYGLVDAPLEWYRSVCQFFQSLGLQRIWSDPCCWVFAPEGTTLGIISAHVDDFLFSGDEKEGRWLQILESIKQKFKWGDWEHQRFVQCGVLLEQHADFSFSLSQEKYVGDLKYINLRAHRKRDKQAPTEEFEKTQLRALLGGISWHAQQVAPHFSAEVGLLLSEVNQSTIDTINRANHLLDRVKEMRQHRLKVHAIPVEELALFAWVDAASQNRTDGSSTQGLVLGAASKRLLAGSCEDISLVGWASQKIDRKCRSPGAAEAMAAVNGEDHLYFARFQLSEMLGMAADVRNVDASVNSVIGCLITDSRNVFDKLETEVMVLKGAEKRTDIELLSLKAAQANNQVIIRWVHGEAQLSNGLTKANEYKELLLFYRMHHRWRIVEDDEKASARRRKTMGLAPLEVSKGNSELKEKSCSFGDDVQNI